MSESDEDLQYFREQLYEVEAENQRLAAILQSARDFVDGKSGTAMSAEHVEQLSRLLNSA
ncbi:hypothetical protein OCH239_14465 [Roseivivax halodurans JCM 10272]|uniref:Uncharacterized protein n=1 Tax=Roseivivax halodurans JCM 10272 TaxID=1449350 RepID=X7EHW2_9RHOB|nr:hypothetical protein [Roseivivax halodurans]ETX15699.1 hypothetical protein OCH239_14465 [Roseivivax halodurans JCM 10272]